MNKTIGEILKQTRCDKGLELPDISKKLCISKTYLRALEGNDMSNLPAQTFTIGFLRTYATHLGLNADEMVEKAKCVSPQKVPTVGVNVPEAIEDSATPNLYVIIAITGVLASLILGYNYFDQEPRSATATFEETPQSLLASFELDTKDVTANGSERALQETSFTPPPPVKQNVKPQERKVVVTPASYEELVKAPIKLETTVAQTEEKFVEIRAKKDTWMMIASSNKHNIFDNIIKKGEVFKAPVGQGLFLTTGNAGGLEFYHGGHLLSIPSGRGDIINAMALDQAVLRPEESSKQLSELLP